MIEYLKGKGYKYTTKDVLNNREFREVGLDIAINRDVSTFTRIVNDVTVTYELFIDTKMYRASIVKDLINDIRDITDYTALLPSEDLFPNGLLYANGGNELLSFDATASVERQERGFLIIFNLLIGE